MSRSINISNKMKTTCFLILLLSASVLSVRHQSMDSERGSLHYFEKFEKDHSKPINKKIPLDQHYSNERKLRKESFKLKEQAKTIRRNAGFKERDLKHKILELKNQADVLATNVHADDKIAKQRERSIKEDINHAEKFKELYEQRGEVNKERLSKALPDQAASLKKLSDFDQERKEHWAHVEDREQKNLQNTVQKDIKANVVNMTKEANVQAQIMSLKTNLSNVSNGAEFAAANLDAKRHHLENEIKKDDILDQQRRENEVHEASAVASPHDEYHENLLHGDDHHHNTSFHNVGEAQL
jgi:hypothetical protein